MVPIHWILLGPAVLRLVQRVLNGLGGNGVTLLIKQYRLGARGTKIYT